MDPRSWDIIFKILKGFQGQYKKSAPKQFKDANGRTNICLADNSDVIKKYSHDVFTKEISVDMSEIYDFHKGLSTNTLEDTVPK
jgi:hypothetical protein